MKKVIKLSETEWNTTQASVVKYLKEHNKSVLAEVPVCINVWSIYENTKHFSDNDPNRIIQYKSAFANSEKESIDTKVICDTKLIKSVDYVGLTESDVSLLLKHGRCKVKEPNIIYWLDSDGEIKKQDRVTTTKEYLKLKSESISETRRSRGNALFPFEFLSAGTKFVFIDRSVSWWGKDNRALNATRSLDVNLDSLHVLEGDVQHLIKVPLDSIPEDSPYYIEIALRNRSDLDKLAEIGYKFFGRNDKHTIKSKDLAKYIMAELGFSQKKADSTAFFLKPNPKGAKGKNKGIALDCQFPYLTHALKRFWLDSPDTPKKVRAAVLGFLEDDGFSPENAKYGELLSRQKN